MFRGYFLKGLALNVLTENIFAGPALAPWLPRVKTLQKPHPYPIAKTASQVRSSKIKAAPAGFPRGSRFVGSRSIPPDIAALVVVAHPVPPEEMRYE